MKKRVGMIRCLFFLSILFFTFAVPNETVKAGDINLPEADLIEFLHGTFEHEGSRYKVKSEYISKAKSIMMREDINLTNDDKSKAISMFYQNIQQGIDEGCMQLISSDSKSESSKEKEQTKDSNTQEQNTDNESGEELGTKSDHKNNELGVKDDKEKEDDSKENEQTLSEDFLGLGIKITEEETADLKNENSNQTESDSIPGENKEVIDEKAKDQKKDNPEPDTKKESSDDSTKSCRKDKDMIKTTGFNHGLMKVILMVLGSCYVLLISIIIYSKIAAKRHEPD